MKIMVINAGSSSVKYKLFDMESLVVLNSGVIERIGEEKAGFIHEKSILAEMKTFRRHAKINDHKQAMMMIADLITDTKYGAIRDLSEIDAVGHRVVQGGEAFSRAVVVDNAVKIAIKDHIKLAPLHNPSNLTGIEVAGKIFSQVPHVAAFDTQFHHTLPKKAFLYGLPYEYYKKYKIRKYGFHGISHQYVSQQAADLMNRPLDETRLITLHLGNGCSVCAVENGKCIDTSMGMTPLCRSNDGDPLR